MSATTETPNMLDLLRQRATVARLPLCSVRAGDDVWSVGSCGKALLAVQQDHGFPPASESVRSVVLGLLAPALVAFDTTAEALFALGVPVQVCTVCPDCKGAKVVSCEECRGTGETECGECEQDRDCEECDGHGKHACYGCKEGENRHAWAEPIPAARVLGVTVNRQRLWLAMQGLTGPARIDVTGPGIRVRGETAQGSAWIACLARINGYEHAPEIFPAPAPASTGEA